MKNNFPPCDRLLTLIEQQNCFPALEGHTLRDAPEGIPYETVKLFPRPERACITGCPRGYRKRDGTGEFRFPMASLSHVNTMSL